MVRVGQVLEAQGGVIARRQALAAGLDDTDLERLLRRREWARAHPGTYVTHTGALTWAERAWAAVLFCWPAALAGPSALRVHGLRSAGGGLEIIDDEPVHVAVDHDRRLVPPAGVLLVRRVDLEAKALLQLGPPRLRIEEALLDVASAAGDESAAIAVLADACQERRTTPERLMATLAGRAVLPRRRLLLEVLADVAEGALSAFEHRYLTRVERAHGLPRAGRQVRVVQRGGVTYRDVEYANFATVIELDGRLVHRQPEQRWLDLGRDVEAAIHGETTLRLGWLHVLQPCRAAELVGRLLGARGWSGTLRPCGPDCAVNLRHPPR